jgi:hypothetical protein
MSSTFADADEQAFSDDVKAGGYTGNCLVGRDLMSVTFQLSRVLSSSK